MQETEVWSLSWKDPLKKEIATNSSILAWEVPWTEEPGGLQAMESQRVGDNQATSTFTFFQALGPRGSDNQPYCIKKVVSGKRN